ncbi:MAG: hypothetical protein RLY71_2670 [Pseudomonadota bacterium]
MVKLFVEGGGDASALKTACREGFTTFITKAGIKKRPRVVACGSRRDAFESYCTAIAQGEAAMLLVDSEASVSLRHQAGTSDQWNPWAHLKARPGDDWDKPVGSADTDCHLMVQVMESWFLADRNSLKIFFGNGFKENLLPPAARPIEGIAKADVYRALELSTANCKTKSSYGKGEHSFKLLARIDAAPVTAASPWAQRFIDQLKLKTQA